MLEHTADPQGPPEDAPPPKAPAAEYYIPKQTAEPLNGTGTAPKVKRFSRKMLLAISIVAAVVITLAFEVGLQTPPAKPAKAETTSTQTPAANADVNALPSGYDQVPQLGEPRPGDLGAVSSGTVAGTNGTGAARQLTPLEQYAEQAQLERVRNEDRARGAAVSFANSGGNDASMGSALATGAADTAQLQERLLELAQRGGNGGPGAGTAANAGAHDDANAQEEKADFANRTRESDFELHATVQKPKSPYTLFAGTILPCVMTQGIDSDLPGQIGCMISQNVYDTVTGAHLLLPQGTKAIGTYDSRVAYGQERVLVVWTRLLRPDGSTLSLEGMPGVDLSGYAGLTGKVNNHYVRLLAGVVLGSILGASAQIAVGANSQNPSFSQLAMQGAGQNINEAGQQITRKNLNIQPTILVPPGGRLNIFATKDLILPPWTESP